jgi:hypothetical protein
VNPHNGLLFLSICAEINLALVWTSIARSAYTQGALIYAAEAKAKAQAGYWNATKLLSEMDLGGQNESLLAELTGLAVKLDELAVLATSLAKAAGS